MVRTLVIPNPKIDRNEVSFLNEDASAAATTLLVASTSGFAATNLVLIGGTCDVRCSDTNEVGTLSTVTAPNTLTLLAGTVFAHGRQTAVTKLDADQIKIYRSTDGGATYVLLATVSIDYASPQKTTEYTDTTGDNTMYYQFAYYNSVLAFEFARSEPIGPTADYYAIGYITVDEFIALTGMKCAGEELVSEAIAYGANEIRRRMYTPRLYQTGNPVQEHCLPVHPRLTFADTDLDNRPINKLDFYAFEEDLDTMGLPGIRTDVTSDIIAVDVDRRTVKFSVARPTAQKRLNIVWHETWEKLKFDQLQTTRSGQKRWMNIHLKNMNKLLAVNYLFENVPFAVLQRGIPTWSLNGVSVSFEYDLMQKVMDDNMKRFNTILQSIEVPYLAFTQFRRNETPRIREFLSTLQFRKTSS